MSAKVAPEDHAKSNSPGEAELIEIPATTLSPTNDKLNISFKNESEEDLVTRCYNLYERASVLEKCYKLFLLSCRSVLGLVVVTVPLLLLPLQKKAHSIKGNAVFLFVYAPIAMCLSVPIITLLFYQALTHVAPSLYLFTVVLPPTFFLSAFLMLLLFVIFGTLIPFNALLVIPFITIPAFLLAYYNTEKSKRPPKREAFQIFLSGVTTCVFAPVMCLYLVGFCFTSHLPWLQSILLVVLHIIIFLFKQLMIILAFKRADEQSSLIIPYYFTELGCEIFVMFVFPSIGQPETMALFVFLQLAPDISYPFFYTQWFWKLRLFLSSLPGGSFLFSKASIDLDQHRKKTTIMLFFNFLAHYYSALSYVVVASIARISWNSQYFPYAYYSSGKFNQTLFASASIVGGTTVIAIVLQVLISRIWKLSILQAGLGVCDIHIKRLFVCYLLLVTVCLLMMVEHVQVVFLLDPTGVINAHSSSFSFSYSSSSV